MVVILRSRDLNVVEGEMADWFFSNFRNFRERQAVKAGPVIM